MARPASFQWTEPALFVSSGAFGAISSGKRKDVLKTCLSKLVAVRTAKTPTASDLTSARRVSQIVKSIGKFDPLRMVETARH